MLDIRRLAVAYGDHRVIQDLNWQLNAVKIHGLVGLNGSGKTTLLNTLYGLVKPTGGTIQWNGSPLRRTDIGFLETQNYFYSNITGREYLSLFSGEGRVFNVDAWEELFQLPLDELIDHYSTGMKKKLALMGILKLDRPILFFDEPFNGLDLESNRILKILIPKLKSKGKTIVITSHILESLIEICDTVGYLKNGKLERVFSKNELHTVEETIFKDTHQQVHALLDRAIGV